MGGPVDDVLYCCRMKLEVITSVVVVVVVVVVVTVYQIFDMIHHGGPAVAVVYYVLYVLLPLTWKLFLTGGSGDHQIKSV